MPDDFESCAGQEGIKKTLVASYRFVVITQGAENDVAC
jgi:hypothetical protein